MFYFEYQKFGQNILTGSNLNSKSLIEFGAQYQSFNIFDIKPIFIHLSLIHLLSNMFALYIFGTFLESRVGSIEFTIIYFISGICGTFTVNQITPDTITAGASGAIFGLISATFAWSIYNRQPELLRNLIFVIIIQLIGSFKSGVSYSAHIGGLIAGIIISIIIVILEKIITSIKERA